MKKELLQTYQAKARKIGYEVLPSKTNGKKLDVFKNGIKVAAIGAKGYADYEIHKIQSGKAYADTRKKLYKKRHASNLTKGNGYLAYKILW